MPFGAEGIEAGTVGLALSGGGFRATLFHCGTLWRLNELGYLGKLTRVSSVSGGSITAGVLARAWPNLSFSPQGIAARLDSLVIKPLRDFCAKSIDGGVVVKRHPVAEGIEENRGVSPMALINSQPRRALLLPRQAVPQTSIRAVGLAGAGMAKAVSILVVVILFAVARPAAALDGLALKSAFFTKEVQSNVPGSPITMFRLMPGASQNLWFFSAVTCIDQCLAAVRMSGGLGVTHSWYLVVGSQWYLVHRLSDVIRDEPRSETGWRFPSVKTKLQQGTYRVTVTSTNEDVCLESGECEFMIEVQ